MPRLFSIVHPLDDMYPVLIKTNMNVNYVTEAEYKVGSVIFYENLFNIFILDNFHVGRERFDADVWHQNSKTLCLQAEKGVRGRNNSSFESLRHGKSNSKHILICRWPHWPESASKHRKFPERIEFLQTERL